MKTILAIESSSDTASVAVIRDKAMIGETTVNNKKTHSQKLMPMIDGLFSTLDLSVNDINYYAVSTGPGSFTGLRIGVSIAKGMAYAAGKSMVAVPTLHALSYNLLGCEGLICPIMDARNEQVYGQIFDGKANETIALCEPVGEPIIDFINRIRNLSQGNKKIWMVGDAVDMHFHRIKEEFGENAGFAVPPLDRHSAVSVGLLAEAMIEKGFISDGASLTPFYLRKSQAEQSKKVGGLL